MISKYKQTWIWRSWLRYSMSKRDYFFTRHINKIKLKLAYLSDTNSKDITIIFSVKNRCDYRLVNAFKSLRNQDYDSHLINIVLVDYDSDKNLIDHYSEICNHYNVKYLRVENKPIWNKSNCLNIAIKSTNTQYICSTDVDVFFEKNYISECISELQKNPHQVLVSDFYNTPKGAIEDEVDVVNCYSKYKEMCGFQITGIGRSGALGVGINLALTSYYKAINGYDEYYTLWGSEDRDLIKRFVLLGLKVKDMSSKTSWIHQHHEKMEGVNKLKHANEQIEKNVFYLKNTHTIIRNLHGWGER